MRSVYVALFSILASGVVVAAADRLTDRDVTELVDRIDKERERFEGALDDRFKNSILRGQAGEVSVSQFLKDFKENIHRLKDRMKTNYAGSMEVTALLRQSNDIDAFFRTPPGGRPGESEWNRLASQLKILALGYGVDFPLAPGATARRMSRDELSGIASNTAKAADQFKKALDGELKEDASVTKEARESAVNDADLLKKDAETIRTLVTEDRLSSSEAERLLSRATAIQKYMAARPKPMPKASAAWTPVAANVAKLAGEYGKPWAAVR